MHYPRRFHITDRSGLRRIAALVLAVGLAVPQAAWASCDPRGEVWGFCLNTLPRLQCCSPAAVTWSQIVVGHRFPVSGVVNPDSYSSAGSSRKAGEAMDIIFPSGKRVALPLDENGRFGRTVTFDEEGSYRLRVPSNGGEVGRPTRGGSTRRPAARHASSGMRRAAL